MKDPNPRHPIVITLQAGRVRVRAAGRVIAETDRALVLREASYPHVLYIPREDADLETLVRNTETTTCPYKGEAGYFDLAGADPVRRSIAWSYETPFPAVARIRERLAFYSDRVDAIETD